MGSNNFDGPILLDSLATLRGYIGTGGRTGEDSVGPRLSGGVPADPNGVLNAIQGSLHMSAGTLWQNTDGATAWSAIASGGSAVSPIPGLFYVDGAYTGGSSNGSIAAPFTTIQAALDAIGVPTTPAEASQSWLVIITGGFYDEDLVVPGGLIITLQCLGFAFLGDALPPTTPRTVTITQNVAPLLGPIEIAAVSIERLVMSDGIIVSSAAPAVAVQMDLVLQDVVFASGFGGTLPSIGASGWTVGELKLTLENITLRAYGDPGNPNCIDGGTNIVYIDRASHCNFEGDISCTAYGNMSFCTFGRQPAAQCNQTYADQTHPNFNETIEGFYNCEFNSPVAVVFTLTIPDNFIVDDTSWGSIINSVAGVSFVGATIVPTSNNYYAGNTPAGNATWAAGGDNSVLDAMDRMASLLVTLNAGTAIP